MYGLTPRPCSQLPVVCIGRTVMMCIYWKKSFADASCCASVQLAGQRGIRDRDKIATAVVCGPADASATVLVLLSSAEDCRKLEMLKSSVRVCFVLLQSFQISGSWQSRVNVFVDRVAGMV